MTEDLIDALDSPLDPFDIASGVVIGADPGVPALENSSAATAREAMTSVVRTALARPPCLVSFSGGRDSSAVLAVALAVARAEGLPPPIPASLRFPGIPGADESGWQDDLLRMLGAGRRWTMPVTTELELFGEASLLAMQRHGLRYPPNGHFHAPLFAAAAGGSLLSGVGGDELLEPYQWARSSAVLAGRTLPRRADLGELASRAAPLALRRRLVTHRSGNPPPWLTPAGTTEYRRRLGAWLCDDPRRFDEHLLSWWWRARYFRHGHASLALLAADHDVRYVAPFMEASVLAALAHDRGRIGFPSRTAAMEALFGDLLPPATMRRATKAVFSNVLVGPATRKFADSADPRGVVDGRHVDIDALSAAWRGPNLDIRSLLSLQACWISRAAPAQASST